MLDTANKLDFKLIREVNTGKFYNLFVVSDLTGQKILVRQSNIRAQYALGILQESLFGTYQLYILVCSRMA